MLDLRLVAEYEGAKFYESPTTDILNQQCEDELEDHKVVIVEPVAGQTAYVVYNAEGKPVFDDIQAESIATYISMQKLVRDFSTGEGEKPQ